MILITVDTLRYDSVFGPEHDNAPLAPNLRGLAREGMQFTRATSPAPWTFPSFCSMMSGLEPLVHNKGRQSGRPVPDLLPETVPTLAERFRAKGWLTGAFVYNHFLGVRFGWDRGFDHYLFANCDFVADVVEDALQAAFGEKVEFKSGRDQTSEITRYGIEWIRRHSDNRYFLWLHYLDPHVPYSPPERFVTSASTRDMGLRFDKQRPEWILRPFPPEERAWLRELYEAELRYVDENVGRILDTLRETGQYDDALIVFTSDHGEEFWEHGQFEHGHQLYSELLHIPFVVKLPKGGVTGVFDQTIASPQLHPTVLDLCGLAYDKALFDYPSLRPVWEDGTTTAGLPGPIWSGYMLYGGDKQALTRGRLKLIHDMERDRFELYDLETDPGERNNLAASRPDLLADMRAELEGHVARAIQKRHELGLDVSREVEASPAMLEGLKDLGYM